MATLNKHFKGILQYKSTDSFTKEPGYIYLVRNVENGNAEVYFGTRKYGEVNASKLAELQEAISANTQSIEAIESKIGQWVDSLGTIAQAVIEVSGATQTNAQEIAKKVDTTTYAAYTATTNSAITNINNTIGTVTGGTIGEQLGQLHQVQNEANEYLSGAIETLETKVTGHTGDADIHVTTDDKAKWNKVDEKVDATAYTAYTAATETAISDAKNAAISAATANTQTQIEALDSKVSGESQDARVKIEVSQTDGKLTALTVETSDIAKNSDLTAHTSNADIHVTTDDKAKWNKAKSDIDAFLAAAESGETALDTLKELQEYINSDSGATTTMLANIASAQTTADKAVEDAAAAQADVDALETAYTAYTATTNSAITNINNTIGTVTGGTIGDQLGQLNQDLNTGYEYLSGAIDTIKADLTGLTAEVAENEKVAAEGLSALNETFEAYTGATDTVLQGIQDKLSAITDNAVTSVDSTGKTVTVTENEGAVNVEVNTLSVADAQASGYIALEHGTDGALYGVMYYGGDDAE